MTHGWEPAPLCFSPALWFHGCEGCLNILYRGKCFLLGSANSFLLPAQLLYIWIRHLPGTRKICSVLSQTATNMLPGFFVASKPDLHTFYTTITIQGGDFSTKVVKSVQPLVRMQLYHNKGALELDSLFSLPTGLVMLVSDAFIRIKLHSRQCGVVGLL